MNRGTFLAILLFFLVLVALASIFGSADRQEVSQAPSSYNPAPRGLKGIQQTLVEAGIDARRLVVPLTELPEEPGTLILVGPGMVPITEREADHLMDWVAAGHRLLLLLRCDSVVAFSSVEPLTDVLGLTRTASRGSFSVALDFPWRVSLAGLTLEGPGGLRRDDLPRVPLVRLVERGRSGLVYAGSWGEGRIVVLADTRPLENAHLLQGTNLSFIQDVLAGLEHDAVVWFDEYHHGYAVQPISSLLRAPAFWLVLIQLALAGALYVGSSLRRTAPIRRIPARLGRRRSEYVRAMASIYERGRQRAHAARVLLTQLQGQRHPPNDPAANAARAALEAAAAGAPIGEKELVAAAAAVSR